MNLLALTSRLDTLLTNLGLVALKTDDFRVVTKTIVLGTGAVPVTENLFAVTGEIEAYVFGFVDAAPLSTGAMTLELGVTGNTAALIAITVIGELDLNEFWTTTTSGVGAQAPPSKFLISAANIVHVIRDEVVTVGTITYYCIYRAISSDGAVAAA